MVLSNLLGDAGMRYPEQRKAIAKALAPLDVLLRRRFGFALDFEPAQHDVNLLALYAYGTKSSQRIGTLYHDPATDLPPRVYVTQPQIRRAFDD